MKAALTNIVSDLKPYVQRYMQYVRFGLANDVGNRSISGDMVQAKRVNRVDVNTLANPTLCTRKQILLRRVLCI